MAKEEQDFFNQAPNDTEKARMTKDSILALYGTGPTTTPKFNGAFNQFGTATPNIPMQHGFGAQFGQNHNFLNASGAPMMNAGGFPQPIPQQGFASFPPPQATVAFGTQQFGQPASQPASNANNINQQFGNLNLGNVWQ